MTADLVDVVIVGGGPIGLAAGIEARLAGMTATVIEPRDAPIDKACGEGLMPGAVAALARLGVVPAGRPFIGISYQRADARVGRPLGADPPPADPPLRADHRFRSGNGLGVRRTALHAALALRADELGVDRVAGRVAGLEQDAETVSVSFSSSTALAGSSPSGTTPVGAIGGRWLLGCDGLHSTVRELLGLVRPTRTSRRFGLRRHFPVSPFSDFVQVRWMPEAEVYITPVADDLVGVAVLGPPHTDYDEMVALIPELAGVEPVTSLRGAGPLRQRTTRRVAGRVLLVGDASGYVDAITGEGIRVGLAQAHAVIGCIVDADPLRYEREWRQVSRDYRSVTSALVGVANGPLRNAIVPLAVAWPGLYGSLVERVAR